MSIGDGVLPAVVNVATNSTNIKNGLVASVDNFLDDLTNDHYSNHHNIGTYFHFILFKYQ